MLRARFYNIFIFCLCVAFSSNAQTSKMTIEQAIETALKNNYDILITRNLAQEAKNKNTLGSAGMLPQVSLVSSENFATSSLKQELSNGTVVDKSGAHSQNNTTGVYLNWTIFDGLKMFATHARLQELQSMGELNMKIQIENTLVKLISAYYNIVMVKQMIKGLRENMAISEERLKIAQKKFDIGTTSKLDLLQANVDLNFQKSALIRENTLLSDSKETLNQIMIQPVDQEFDVLDTIPLMNEYKYEDLKNSILTNNSDLLFAQKNINVSSYLIKEAKSVSYPQLSLTPNYLFTRSQNQAGFLLLNQNLGLNLGFSVSWTLFNGFNNINNVKNAKLDLENSNLTFNNLTTLTQLSLIKAFKKYQGDITILQLQIENKKLAKENLDIGLELFKLGTTNSIQLQTAQQSYQNSIDQLSNAFYNAKISETQLLKLSGGIVK